jgi:DNA-binding transcriptional MerR regulator
VDKAPDAFRTISEVAEELELPQHVLRFWETRFSQIRPMKRGGGRRYYRPDDVDLLRGIRHLLYGEGYTIRGVQRLLKDEGVKFVQAVWKTGAPSEEPSDLDDEDFEDDDEEPGRGLLGLWPSLLGMVGGPEDRADVGDRIEPPVHGNDAGPSAHPAASPEGAAPAPPAAAEASGVETAPVVSAPAAPIASAPAAPAASTPAPPVRGLTREAVVKLQATLSELTECRRLIDAALLPVDN